MYNQRVNIWVPTLGKITVLAASKIQKSYEMFPIFKELEKKSEFGSRIQSCIIYWQCTLPIPNEWYGHEGL